MKLFELCKNVLLKEALYSRSPYFPVQDQIEFVQKQSFLLDVLGEKRSLSALEVSHLYHNTERNMLGIATLLGFSQTAQSKEVNGANLMIKNKWLEQPPLAFDRKDLADENKRS